MATYSGHCECEACGTVTATRTHGEGEYCRDCDNSNELQDLGSWACYREDNWSTGVRRIVLTWDSVIVGFTVFLRSEFRHIGDDKIVHADGWWAKPWPSH
jgi:hypothetical protein